MPHTGVGILRIDLGFYRTLLWNFWSIWYLLISRPAGECVGVWSWNGLIQHMAFTNLLWCVTVYTYTYCPMERSYMYFGVFILFQTYTVKWKRSAFFKFVEIFHDGNWPQDLKAKVSMFEHTWISIFQVIMTVLTHSKTNLVGVCWHVWVPQRILHCGFLYTIPRDLKTSFDLYFLCRATPGLVTQPFKTMSSCDGNNFIMGTQLYK